VTDADADDAVAAGRGRSAYLISGDQGSLRRLLDELEHDLEAGVRRRLGSAEKPELIVADLRKQDVDLLREQYGPAIEIEPDLPLDMYRS